MRTSDYGTVVARLVDKNKRAAERVNRETDGLQEATERMEAAQEAQQIVQTIAQAIQQRVHDKIAGVVSLCLDTVFVNPYQFRMLFERKRGKTEARLTFVRDGVELTDPLNEVGGGCIDVAAFALRLACVVMAKPLRRRLLVLDEPWKNIRGKGNRERAKAMLVKLAEDMGFQIILNTDIPTYQVGKIIELGDE